MKTKDIRKAFLDFFAAREHRVVPSAPLVPQNDPTLLFTNAGMVPFKDAFLGNAKPPAPRVVDVQRCLRAGGKHNDLENVGYTARHHTFFEMLGNWSFGDYFKREAIEWCWELLTGALGLPAEKLWATVYATDDEAYDIWANRVGLPESRIVRIGDNKGAPYASDNFWQMADTGPCGPCSEIFYDHGPEVAGGPPGSPEEDCDRFVEVWNLVFMQFDRAADGTLKPLPVPCVDTGMGLERIAAVLQGVHSNYDIDLFRRLIVAAAQAVGRPPRVPGSQSPAPSLQVIADHIRATAFLIADGVLPSNEGRGYVLRRIMRRAIRHGFQLGQTKPFFYKLVAPLVAEMGGAYPELAHQQKRIEEAIFLEEERFAQTIGTGMRLLDEAIAELDGKVLSGETAFKLYDTYGFPVDLTADIARERGLEVDMAGFERAMAAQRERARAASHFGADYSERIEVDADTEFAGYEDLEASSQVSALFHGAEPVERLHAGQEGAIVVERTPFYAESGGQVGDTGVLRAVGARFLVTDTQKRGAAFVHLGRLEEGAIALGDELHAEVAVGRRAAIVLNHSATHLLHAALRQVLGEHVTQRGSLVAPERLRFDFSHSQPVTDDELREIETRVNTEIRRNVAAEIREMPYEEAIAAGAMALFGEKYGETVRVMRFGDFSTELCGGTHVARTGDIGLFKIIGQSGIAAGIRRIEAVTGESALAYIRGEEDRLVAIAGLVKAGRDDVTKRVDQLVERSHAQEKELAALREKLAGGAGGDLAEKAVEVAGARVVAARLDGADAKALRSAVDRLKDKLGTAAIVLGAVDGEKVRLAAGVTKDLTQRLPAGELVNAVADEVGGRGGGRADFAQAGGSQPDKLDAALAHVTGFVESRLAS
jgi:alanyl-tRNA synthetase